MTNSTQLGTRIVHEVAAREGVDPTNLGTRLYDAIDVDALESIVANATERGDSGEVCVAFDFHGYRITVTGQGAISLEDLETVS
jgi:hypothetical protein